jgi:hypothetical protein
VNILDRNGHLLPAENTCSDDEVFIGRFKYPLGYFLQQTDGQ